MNTSTIQDFSGYNPTWCPGCGDWGIGIAIKQALIQLGLNPSSVAAVFGIGCSGNMNDFFKRLCDSFSSWSELYQMQLV